MEKGGVVLLLISIPGIGFLFGLGFLLAVKTIKGLFEVHVQIIHQHLTESEPEDDSGPGLGPGLRGYHK